MTEIGAGKKKRTVIPPKMPCVTTTARAIQPSLRTKGRSSLFHNQNSENDREEPDKAGHHPVSMFVKDTPNHRWRQRSIRQRPVWNRQTGIVPGNQSAGDDQKKRAARREDRKPVECPVSNWRRMNFRLH